MTTTYSETPPTEPGPHWVRTVRDRSRPFIWDFDPSNGLGTLWEDEPMEYGPRVPTAEECEEMRAAVKELAEIKAAQAVEDEWNGVQR